MMVLGDNISGNMGDRTPKGMTRVEPYIQIYHPQLEFWESIHRQTWNESHEMVAADGVYSRAFDPCLQAETCPTHPYSDTSADPSSDIATGAHSHPYRVSHTG
jgi:hypothetical protein